MEQNKNLMDQENMKKFLQLLEENGMHDEKLSVQLLAGYVDQMESQFTTVLEELKNVRQELSTIQDKTLRATAGRAVDKVVVKVEEAKNQVIKLKKHIMKSVDKAVSDFKEHGKSALVTAMKSLNVKGLLETIKGSLNHAVQSADHGIDHLTKLGDNIHVASYHLKNAGRVLAGKEADKIPTRDTEKGFLAKAQSGLFASMNALTTMATKTDNTIHSLNEFEQKHEPKKSVKSELKDIKNKQHQETSTIKMGKEKELEQR